MPTANLRLNVRAIGENDAINRIGNAVRLFGNTAGRAVSRIPRSPRGMGILAKAAIFFAPALFTLGKAALAGAGGLIALAAVVSLAALPFIGLAITAARNAEKMGAAGRRFERGADRVGTAWMDLARRTAPLTLGPAVDVLNGMAAAIPKLEPLVRAIAPVFADVGRDIRRWLQGNDFERFTSNLQDFGVPAFRNLVAAGRDFIATVGIGFRAFLPLARDMHDTFAKAASQLRDWAGGGGFDRFLQGVKDDWPTTKRFLDELGESLGIIGGLLSDLGTGQLAALDTFLGAFNKLDPDTLRNAVLALFGVRLLAGLGGLFAAVAAMRAADGLAIASAGALAGAAAALSAAGGPLLGMAARVTAQAARTAASGATSVNSDALDRIRDIWDDIKDGGTVTLIATSVNLAIVAMMGVATTAATLQLRASEGPATFVPRLDTALFIGVVAGIAVAWLAVRLLALLPVLFRGMAVPGNVVVMAGTLIGAWNGVRAMAALPVVFRATANGAAAIAGMARAVAAWARVSSMPRSWSGTATANSGPAVAGSSATVAAWRSVLAMPRSWSAVASVVVNGGFGGIGGGGSITVDTSLRGGYGPLPGPVLNFLGNIPGFDDFGSMDIPSDAEIAPGFFEPFDLGDFDGPAFADGGQVGGTPRSSSIRRRERHVHVHGDIWVKNQAELQAVLEEAIAQLD